MRMVAALGAALFLVACNEVPQDAVKPYAGKQDTQPYAGDRFKGDKVAFEKALAERSQFQDDYAQTRAATKQ